jgi:iron complex transport system substrate-binding protein
MDDAIFPRFPKLDAGTEAIASKVVDAAWRVHQRLGPCLRESHYQRFLHHGLLRDGLKVAREVRFPLSFEGLRIEGALRLDLLVEECVVVEVKASALPLIHHEAQMLSYLRHTGLPIGFVVNFREPMFRASIRRYANSAPGRRSMEMQSALTGPPDS